MKKNILIINAVWLIVAVAAFALGRFDSSSRGAADAPSSADLPIGKSGAVAEAPKSATDKAKENAKKETAAGEIGNLESMGIEVKPILTDEDMVEAVLNALNEPNPLKANLLFAQLLTQITPDNVEVAMDTLREHGDGRTMFQQMGLLTYAYGAMDGEKAMEYAQGIGGRGSIFTSSSALSGWASENPQDAMTWLESQEDLDGMEKAMFARGLVNGLAQTNLKLATEYAVSIEDRDMQRQFFDVIAREQMKGGIESASAWVNTLPEDAKSGALENVARQVARDDLEVAKTWAQKYATEPYGARAIAEVADELAEEDPNSALEFVYGLPEGDAQNRGIAATFRELTRNNFEEANALINEMPPSPQRDYALSSFIGEARRDDPQGALALAQTINDPGLREQSIVQALQPLYRADPQAAINQAAALGISEQARQQLERQPDFRGDGFRGGPGGGRGRGGPPRF